MSTPKYSELEVGAAIPSLTQRPITRQTLAVYCGASGDHNPVHVDIDFARAAGLPDVIAHGMLVMAYMGRTLTQWVSQERMRAFSTRFMAMTHIGDAITCTGAVLEKLERDGEKLVRVSISAADQRGEVKTAGEALIALDP
ncbi:MAG: MaoC family dehydratase [Gammaproteobacteria bacterium]|nr:MaoC family dehydratase [Gammaproteobacteria bacterium]MBI5616461.1 MaoC family dehydratase [Gammaproteobacteria bacterium]